MKMQEWTQPQPMEIQGKKMQKLHHLLDRTNLEDKAQQGNELSPA
jgi:hypothetical protein